VLFRTPDRRQSEKRGFTTKRDAERFARTVEVDKDRGEFVRPTDGRVTVSEIGAAWLNAKRLLKPSTYRGLESRWRQHVQPAWGDIPIASIDPSDVQDWVTKLSVEDGYSATTVRECHSVLAGLLDRAVRDRRLKFNPARGVDLPAKAPKPRVYLSHDQVTALAEAAGEHETLVYVLAYCGLRWGEAVGLRVKHLEMLRRRLLIEENAVQLGGSRIEVGTPKTHERRSVPFPQFLATPLAQACAGRGRDDLVFSRADGSHLRRPRPATPSSRGGWFDYAVQRAGLPRVTPHDLRHTAASLAIADGASVKSVQRMLGHKSAAMTLDTYADLFDADLDAVAERLDAGRAAALKAI